MQNIHVKKLINKCKLGRGVHTKKNQQNKHKNFRTGMVKEIWQLKK